MIKGIYTSPFWIVKLKISKENANSNNLETIAFIGEPVSDHKYNTRSKKLPDCAKVPYEETKEINTGLSKNNENNKENESEIVNKENNLQNKHDLGSEKETGNNYLIKRFLGRKIHTLNSNPEENEINEISDITYENNLTSGIKNISKSMLWHLKLSHASKPYLISFSKLYPGILSAGEINKDTSVSECEACLMSKSCKLPFNHVKTRANRPRQVLHADTMGPISPVAHPKEYRFVLVIIDDY